MVERRSNAWPLSRVTVILNIELRWDYIQKGKRVECVYRSESW